MIMLMMIFQMFEILNKFNANMLQLEISSTSSGTIQLVHIIQNQQFDIASHMMCCKALKYYINSY